MEKAVCYIRVGPGEQNESGLTVKDQTRQLKSYCKDHDLEAILIIRDDQVSGTLPLSDRLGGGDLMQIMKTSGVQHLVSLRLDRLFRNGIDAWERTKVWIDEGIVLHIVDAGGQPIRTDGEIGPVVVGMMIGYSGMERIVASERTRSILARKKANGFVYGVTPFGYDLDGSQLIPNDQEQKIIRQVIAWREAGWSLRRIAGELNDTGILTKQADPSKTPTKWYASTVRYLLANPLHRAGEQEGE